MRGTKDEPEKGAFTKYVEMALMRTRKGYINREQKRQMKEGITDPEQLCLETGEEAGWDIVQLRLAPNIPWKPECIKSYLKELINERVWASLLILTDTELLIVFAKVFRQLTFREIGVIMEMDWTKVASAYSYARKKLKKGLEKNGI